MLNEPASSVNDRPVSRLPVPVVPDEYDSQIAPLREMVRAVMAIDSEIIPEDADHLPIRDAIIFTAGGSRLLASFEGHLLMDSETAYDQLDRLLEPLGRLALFREVDNKHVVHILTGRANPKPRPWWPNLLLFIATLFSVLLVGTNIAINDIASVSITQAQAIAQNGLLEIWRGLPYALSIMLILGSHELGHYFAARRHKLAVTLPYFIPLPFISPFGTLGAFIQLRQPMRNRKMLMDVGASGPLVGLIFAVPILLIGLASMQPHPISSLGGVYEGDSLLYALAKIVTYGRFVPDGQVDVCVNCSQLAWAGWTGLLVTALNLFPLGQLDGGHIIYSAIGDGARKLYYPLMGLMLVLTLFVSNTWWLWLILLFFLGRVYAAPLDTITPLDKPRRIIALVAVIAFVLIFIPAPLTPTSGSGLMRGGLAAMVIAPAVLQDLARRWRRA